MGRPAIVSGSKALVFFKTQEQQVGKGLFDEVGRTICRCIVHHDDFVGNTSGMAAD